uniref:Syndetin C-terminal domain-containing protein n=1 Tax=Meloidogyne enterolobii TaxID=390850 RepID=A0A6V7WPK4_MELEN|nr:unnamed protein product [Meloidogyne enterolobii]
MDFVLIENSTTFDVFPTLEQINSSPSHSCDSKFSNSLSCDSPEDELDSIQILQNKSMPNLCNTALNILRIIGKYLRMAKILKSTAEQVFDAILQLFYYFVYSLYKYFCLDVQIQQQQQEFGTIFTSLRLRQLMDNVQNTYFCQTNGDSVTDEIHHFPAFPNLSPDLNNNEALFSLAERLIGVESATFLSKQMELLRPTLETLVIDKKRGQDLENFFNTLPATSDLLEATLGCVAAKSLQSAQILQQISLIDWNISEIPSEHSNYVYSILKEFESSKEILCKLSVYVHISEEVNFMIWSMMSMCTVRLLVRGYSESNKCSNEGRALQLMDVEHLFKKLEELIGLRPFPHRLYVENYVKAFFLPSDELNEWIVRHTEYTLSQTGALLNASISNAPSATKKAVTMSRIMVNLLDASGISDGSNSFFH